VEEEVFSLAPETPRKNASYVAIGVLVAIVAAFLFVVSQKMDSGAHHYDTAAANQDLVTAAPTTSTTVVAVNKFTAGDAHFRASFPANPKRSVQSFTGGDGKR
jgi:multidrug resistance efflux pump